MKLSLHLLLIYSISAGCYALDSSILTLSFQSPNVINGKEVCPVCIRNTSVNVSIPDVTFDIDFMPNVNYTQIPFDNVRRQNFSRCFIAEVDTNVTCILTTSDGGVTSKAMIYVQGLLSAVTNLSSHVTLDCNSATLLITWIPPPTLQGVPIKNNSINISRLDDGESVNSNTTIGNISKYRYNASNQLGETLVIAVTPVNDAGQGNSTKINITVPLQTMTCVDSSTIRMSTPTETTTVTRTPTSSPTQSPTAGTPDLRPLGALVFIPIAIIIIVAVIIFVLYKKKEKEKPMAKL